MGLDKVEKLKKDTDLENSRLVKLVEEKESQNTTLDDLNKK